MSIDIMNKVWLRGPQDAKQRLLLMAIADHANDKGEAYPGVERLAQRSCQSERNALRGIHRLKVEGWIFVFRRRHGERSRGNEYLINLARLEDGKTAEKTAEPGILSRGDTVSCGGAERVANRDTCDSPSDTLSCGDSEPDEVTRHGHEVTESTPRGDKTHPRIENRKEPPEEPIHPPTPLPGGRDAETADPDGKQRELWALTNRVRARGGQPGIAWEPWVESQKLARQWPESKNSLDLRDEKPARGLRGVRPSRNSRALIGVFRGG